MVRIGAASAVPVCRAARVASLICISRCRADQWRDIALATITGAHMTLGHQVFIASRGAGSGAFAQTDELVSGPRQATTARVLVHRVIVRESKYRAICRARHHRLMQIKLATARGSANRHSRGAADPATNLATASNTSPALFAPPAAITAAPCIIMPAVLSGRKTPALEHAHPEPVVASGRRRKRRSRQS